MTKKKLTAKQRLFVAEYLIDLNATQAAIRAGYSKNCAQEIGWQNLRKLQISDAITAASAKRLERVGVDADWVLKNAKAMHDDAIVAKEWPSRGKAIELIGKHIHVGAFETRHKHIGDPDKPIHVILNATDRAARVAELLAKGMAATKDDEG